MKSCSPLGYLIGIGCFDYWFRWASGAPTIPEDHSGHGAYSWRDYFRVNTDHKVIGIQYICTTFFFFIAGGLMAMLMRAELAQPGTQFVDPNADVTKGYEPNIMPQDFGDKLSKEELDALVKYLLESQE